MHRTTPVVGFGAAALVALILAGSAATGTTTKSYTANICAVGVARCVGSAPQLSGGSTASLDLTIANKAGTQSLGSADVTAPTGFRITGVSPSSSGTFSGGSLKLRNMNIGAGTSRTFTITVSVPCQPPDSSAWTITAKQSNDFNGPPGNNFTLDPANSSLTTPVAGSCKLVWIRQPANAQVGRTITSAAYDPAGATVKVEVHDGNDALVTSATGTVTLTADSNPASFANTTSSLSNGAATFPSLNSGTAGTYTLTASASGIAPSVASSSFEIGSKLVFLSQPQDAQTGATITSVDLDPGAAKVQVAVVPPSDSAPYDPIVSANGSATLTPSPTGSFTGTSAAFSSGVATFSALTGTVTGTYTVTANDQSSSTSATSDPFAITDFGAICPAGQTTCTGSAGSDKNTKASVTSTTSDGFPSDTTLEITMLASAPPAGACAGFAPAPGSNGVAVDVRPLTDLTEVTITLDKSIVNQFPDNGVSHFNVCFGGINLDHPGLDFPTKPGTPAAQFIDGFFWGILPDCSGTPTTPCVASRNKTGSGKAVIVFDVPNPWDLRGYTG